MKSVFEQMGGVCTQQGDYFLPDFQLPPEEDRPIGVRGQRGLRYLWEHRPILYTNLKIGDHLHSHLTDVEEQANALFLRLVKEICRFPRRHRGTQGGGAYGVGRRMNEIRARVSEMVNAKIVFI